MSSVLDQVCDLERSGHLKRVSRSLPPTDVAVAAAVLCAVSAHGESFGLASRPAIEGRSPDLPPSKESVPCINVLSRTMLRPGESSSALPLMTAVREALLIRYCDAPTFLRQLLAGLEVVGPQKKVFPGGFTAWTTGGIRVHGRSVARIHFDDGTVRTTVARIETGVGSERVACRVQMDVPTEDADDAADEATETMSVCVYHESDLSAGTAGSGVDDCRSSAGGGGGSADAEDEEVTKGRPRSYSDSVVVG